VQKGGRYFGEDRSNRCASAARLCRGSHELQLAPAGAAGEHKWSSANDVSEKKRKQNQIMKRENRITALAAALALFASGLTVAAATDDINPADFTTQIDNPFFP